MIRESAWDKLLLLSTRKQMGWLAPHKLRNCHHNPSKDICIIYISLCHRRAECKHYVTWINNGEKTPNPHDWKKQIFLQTLKNRFSLKYILLLFWGISLKAACVVFFFFSLCFVCLLTLWSVSENKKMDRVIIWWGWAKELWLGRILNYKFNGLFILSEFTFFVNCRWSI